MKNKEICKLMQRFLDNQPTTDKELNIIGDHLKDCKRCSLEAAAFIYVMNGGKLPNALFHK